MHLRRNLPYSSTTYAGDGFALVGDASAFLDPLYSQAIEIVGDTTLGVKMFMPVDPDRILSFGGALDCVDC